MTKSKDFIFKEVDEKLVFIGDFEGYYQDTEDPWDQSATANMSDYYLASRERLVSHLNQLPLAIKIAEIGCGLGYVTAFLAKSITNSQLEGFDISVTAVQKARQRFPNLKFTQADITAVDFRDNHEPQQFDVVILNQVLWYILDSLPQVLLNMKHILRSDGYLLISNAFAREQRYGAQVIDHFDGAAKYFRQQEHFTLLRASFYNDHYEHDDGHFLLQVNN